MKKIVISGGHLTPALAVIEELQQYGGWEIFFIGRKYAAEEDKTPSLEAKIITDQGIKFLPVNFGRLQHHFTRYTIPALLRIPWGFIRTYFYLIKIKPDVVLSFGSYVGLPVVFNAWLLKIPAAIHEQTTVVGLGNKIARFFAKKIFVSWPETLKFLPEDKTVLTGNPFRKNYFSFNQRKFSDWGFSKKQPLVLVTGGNQGSHRINLAIEKILPKILMKYNLFHQTGHLEASGDFERLKAAKDKLPISLKNNYQVRKYLTGEEWGSLLTSTDLIVARAGINTITEALFLGKPQLLIPIPWLPGDEQTKNALMVKQIGLGEILLQEDLSPENLLDKIDQMIKNLDKYSSAGTQTRKLVSSDAAKKIVDELEKMA